MCANVHSRAEWLPDSETGLLRTFDELRQSLSCRLFQMLGNHEDVEDTLQVAFLHCWQARDGLPGVLNIRAWLWRVTLNAGRDLQDRVRIRRCKPISTARTQCHQPSPIDRVLQHEEEARLRQALTFLRPEENELFLLRQQTALTYEEIAAVRGRPVGSEKTLMRAAVRKLKKILQSPQIDCLFRRQRPGKTTTDRPAIRSVRAHVPHLGDEAPIAG
jgi:RNA polymerase sigma-70 factor (ECF subfamily)